MWLRGRNPIIRTMQYLNSGRIYLSDRIKVFSAHFNVNGDPRHQGLCEFYIWHFPQIQYKNPNVHCIAMRNLTPTPFIRVYLNDCSDVIIDVDNKDRKEILNHVIDVLGKPKVIFERERLAQEKKENPANFGYLCSKHCMCQIMGQVPCPTIIPVPQYTRAKWRTENMPKTQKKTLTFPHDYPISRVPEPKMYY